MPKTAPHGSWKSPITTEVIAGESIRFGSLFPDGDDLCWTEFRPQEGGRTAIVRKPVGADARDALPLPFNARTRVHEYGGGAAAAMDGVIYFSNFADQRLYRILPGQEPAPITPELALRFADVSFDRKRARLYCVREDHRSPGEAVNTIVVMPLDGDAEGGRVVAAGRDFYSSPRLSPDGRTLAWVSWDHPNMPWDDTELWMAPVLPDGSTGTPRLVAGGTDESVMEPRWSSNGELCFISDRTGFWNLYRVDPAGSSPIEALCPMEAEVGGPAWVFGTSHFDFASHGRIVFAYALKGFWRLAVLGPGARDPHHIGIPYTEIRHLRVSGESAFIIAGSALSPECIVKVDLAGAGHHHEVVRASSALMVDPGYVSAPEGIEFPTEGGGSAHGYFYQAKNKDFAPPPGELPPFLVMSHGGPTGQASSSFDLEVQYWTSRGIAVLDVNYRGSTGYGRAYRNALRGRWGVADVDDCVNGAEYLARRGAVDRARAIIRGGSAGGYTTLAALTFRSYFKAGASYYGIGDLAALAKDTHKFESRYLDGLVGPYPAAKDVYRERSPAFFTERLSSPLILFQGPEDKVVPPSQAVTMFEALRRKGVPVAYLPFEGEQHGFRKAENIKRSLEAELYFYARVFGFALSDAIEPVTIENL